MLVNLMKGLVADLVVGGTGSNEENVCWTLLGVPCGKEAGQT